MTHQDSVAVGCNLLSEFIDDAASNAGEEKSLVPSQTEIVHPQQILSFIDQADPGPTHAPVVRRFTILFKDKSQATVQGHALQAIRDCTPMSYAVVLYEGGRKLIVSLVRAEEVIGIIEDGLRNAGPRLEPECG